MTRVLARPPTIEKVTRRIWVMLAAGVALVAAAGGTAFATRGSSTTFRPAASWNLYRPADWNALAGRTGFRPATVHVVTATVDHRGRPFALLAGNRRGRTCFVLARGSTLGAPLCRLERPLTLFAMRDRWQGRPVTDVLGLVRHDVASVASTARADGRAITAGQPLIPVPGGFAFGSGSAGSALTLVARDASGAVVARVHVAP